jgi:hypothetical protein
MTLNKNIHLSLDLTIPLEFTPSINKSVDNMTGFVGSFNGIKLENTRYRFVVPNLAVVQWQWQKAFRTIENIHVGIIWVCPTLIIACCFCDRHASVLLSFGWNLKHPLASVAENLNQISSHIKSSSWMWLGISTTVFDIKGFDD